MPAQDLNVLLPIIFRQIDQYTNDIFQAREQFRRFIALQSGFPAEVAKLNIDKERQKYYAFVNVTVIKIISQYSDSLSLIMASDQIILEEKRRQLFIRGSAIMYWELYEKIITKKIKLSDSSINLLYSIAQQLVMETSKPVWSDFFVQECEKIFLHLAEKLDIKQLIDCLNEIQLAEKLSVSQVSSQLESNLGPSPVSTPEAAIDSPKVNSPDVKETIIVSDTANSPEVVVANLDPAIEQFLPIYDSGIIKLSLLDITSEQPQLITTESSEHITVSNPPSIDAAPAANIEDKKLKSPSKKKHKKKQDKDEFDDLEVAASTLSPIDKLKEALRYKTDSSYAEAIELLRSNSNNLEFKNKSDSLILQHIKSDANKPKDNLLNFLKRIKLGYECIKYATTSLATRISPTVREIAFSKIIELSDPEFYALMLTTNVVDILQRSINDATSSKQKEIYKKIDNDLHGHLEHVMRTWGVQKINLALYALFNNNYEFTSEDGECSADMLKMLANQKNELGETPLMRCIQRAHYEPADSKIFSIINFLIENSLITLGEKTFSQQRNVMHYWAQYYNPAVNLSYLESLWGNYQSSLELGGKRDYLLSIGGDFDVDKKTFLHVLIENLSDQDQALAVFQKFDKLSGSIYVLSLIKDSNNFNIYNLLDAKPQHWPEFYKMLGNKIPAHFFKFSELLYANPVCGDGTLRPSAEFNSIQYKVFFDCIYLRLEKISYLEVNPARVQAILLDYHSIRVKVKQMYEVAELKALDDYKLNLILSLILELFNISSTEAINPAIENSYLWYNTTQKLIAGKPLTLEPSQRQELISILNDIPKTSAYWYGLRAGNLAVLKFVMQDCEIPLDFQIIYSALFNSKIDNQPTKEIITFMMESFKDHPDCKRLNRCSYVLFGHALLSMDVQKIELLRQIGFNPSAKHNGISVLGTVVKTEKANILADKLDAVQEVIYALFPGGVPEEEMLELDINLQQKLQRFTKTSANVAAREKLSTLKLAMQ